MYMLRVFDVHSFIELGLVLQVMPLSLPAVRHCGQTDGIS